ncbi:MAG: alpha/beta fold hydrolase [Acidobacteriia bacterium]|nr:alpha/beta fold hydrolase [Terriglobia bacterium]
MRHTALVAVMLTLVLAVPALAGPAVTGFAPVEGGKLFYEVLGKGPAVVLIHGGMLDHRAWDPQIAALTRGHRVVRYDAAGHGQSPVPDKPWKTYEHLRALLTQLGIRHAAIVGHSMGARIAIDLAIADPELVDALVLISPGMSGFPFTGRDFLQSSATMAAAQRAGNAARASEYFMRSWVAGPHRTPAQVDKAIWEKALLMALPNALHQIDGPELDPPAVGRLAEVKAPTLVIEGALDCEDIHLIGRLIERRVAGTRRVVIPGVAHLAGLEAPAEVSRLIVDFLRAPVAARTAPARPEVEQTFVDVPGGRLWAERQGEGEAVLLVHDGIVHSPLWDDVAPLWATQYTVIRYDRRGYGHSDRPSAPYSQVADLADVLNHFGVERVNLVGSSAGGGLCIDYALAHPEQVLSLTLVGPVVTGMSFTRHLTNRGGRLTVEIYQDPERFRKYWTTTDPFYLAPESTEARKRVAAILEANPHNLDFSRDGLEQEPPPALPRLGEIRVPTLVLVGEHDIGDVHAAAGVIQVGVRDARRVIVPHSGHGVPVERPDVLELQALTHLQDRAFLTALANQGPDAAAEALRAARRADPAAVLVSEQELNRRGYELLSAGKPADAVKVFRLATAAFPASANTYDSLAEGLLAAGDRDGARTAYRKALEVDPASPSARQGLASLDRPAS